MARVPTKLDYVLDVYIDRSMVHKEHNWEGFHFDFLYHNVHSKTYNVDLCDFAHLAINLWYLSFLVKYFGHYRFQCCNCYHLLSVFSFELQSFMKSFHYKIASMQNVLNFVSIIGIDSKCQLSMIILVNFIMKIIIIIGTTMT